MERFSSEYNERRRNYNAEVGIGEEQMGWLTKIMNFFVKIFSHIT